MTVINVETNRAGGWCTYALKITTFEKIKCSTEICETNCRIAKACSANKFIIARLRWPHNIDRNRACPC